MPPLSRRGRAESSAFAIGHRDHSSSPGRVHRQRQRGRCTLHFQGRNYPFKLGGLGIGGIGVSRLDATGTVYNLNRLEDFNGVYGQTRTGYAAGEHGTGQMWLENPNGVRIHLSAQRRGLALSLGADGMAIHLGS